MKNKSGKSLSGSILTGIALFLIAFGAGVLTYANHINKLSTLPVKAAFSYLPEKDNQKRSVHPISLQIASVGMNLHVKQGAYNQSNNTWTIDSTDAFFTSSTGTPLIYGHNTNAVFSPLANLRTGYKMRLTYNDGTSKYFQYDTTKFIAPNDLSVLSEKHNNTVMLMTCNGFFSETRRVVYFKAMS